jgi:putative ABC transport system substrate-binding protein
MKELGWEEGRNYHMLFVWREPHSDQDPMRVGELIAQGVNVIVVFGNRGIEAALRASTTIPIVGMTDDLVKSGFAVSMTHPGGNLTGVSLLTTALDLKRLELLHEAVPTAKRIGVLADRAMLRSRTQFDEAAHKLSLELVVVDVRNREDLAQGLDALGSAHVDAVNVLASPILNNARGFIIERLNQMRLPAMYEWPETAEEGGLLGYGTRNQLALRQLFGLVAKILRGARPQDLPIEQPAKFDFVVNLKTAKVLGLTIPGSILARADEVIE